MRNALDTTYRAAALLAAACLIAIFTLVVLQVLGRLVDMLLRIVGATPLGLLVPSIAEIGGFLLGASIFLALPYTLKVGGHIRVGLIVDKLPAGGRRAVDLVAGFGAALLAGFFTYALARLTLKSWTFNDVSYGFIAVPLWIPQAVMTLGLALLTIAVVDATLAVLLKRSRLPGASEV